MTRQSSGGGIQSKQGLRWNRSKTPARGHRWGSHRKVQVMDARRVERLGQFVAKILAAQEPVAKKASAKIAPDKRGSRARSDSAMKIGRLRPGVDRKATRWQTAQLGWLWGGKAGSLEQQRVFKDGRCRRVRKHASGRGAATGTLLHANDAKRATGKKTGRHHVSATSGSEEAALLRAKAVPEIQSAVVKFIAGSPPTNA